jgi:hypothetical protein
MVTRPDSQRLTVDDRLAEISKRYGPDSLIGRFIAEARPDLVGAAHRTPTRRSATGPASVGDGLTCRHVGRGMPPPQAPSW